jgi:hypothetical protein
MAPPSGERELPSSFDPHAAVAEIAQIANNKYCRIMTSTTRMVTIAVLLWND